MLYLKFRKLCWVPDKAHAGLQVNLANKKKKEVEQEEDPAPDNVQGEPDTVFLAN
jgi:hypothetical protein